MRMFTWVRKSYEAFLESRSFEDAIRTVDLIIHCGDIAAGYVLNDLREIAPVEAVYGNMDPVDLKQQLPKTQVLKVGGIDVGIVHGDGYRKTIDNTFNAFPFMDLDCIVFSHSLIPVITEREGVLMLNPGSPTDKRMQKQYS
jgi:putative phosphoesterase